MPDEVAAGPALRFLWNPRYHTDRAQETLAFYALQFRDFDRDAAIGAIDKAVSDAHIRSAVCYNFFGSHDLLLRTWLPQGLRTDAFSAALAGFLGEYTSSPRREQTYPRVLPFAVAKETPFAFHRPIDVHKYSDTQLLAIERYFLLAEPESESLAQEANESHHICDYREHLPQPAYGEHVKFVVSVRRRRDLASDARRGLERALHERVRQCTDLHTPDAARRYPVFPQLSLYCGDGFTHYLLLGLVRGDSFSAMRDALVNQLLSDPLRRAYGIRTRTAFAATPWHVLASEGLTTIQHPELVAQEHPAAGSFYLESHPAAPAAISASPESGSDAQYTVGSLIDGRYEISAKLGSGGQADVYKVWDRERQLAAALKVHFAASPRNAREEAEILRRLHHPCVAAHLHAGVANGSPYLVTEFIDGSTLRQVMQEQPDLLTDNVVLDLGDKILDALTYMHPADPSEMKALVARKGSLSEAEFQDLLKMREWGTIHRDLKPENLMLTHDRHLKIVDFSISSPAGSDTKTRSGTFPYMAPDAGVGGWQPVDDLFSLGVVLYELLSGGRYPYVADDGRETGTAILIDKRCPTLDQRVVPVVMKACAASRVNRYQSAHSMRAALNLFTPP